MYPDTSLHTENSEVGNQQYREDMKLKRKERKEGRGSMGGVGAGVGTLWPVGSACMHIYLKCKDSWPQKGQK